MDFDPNREPATPRHAATAILLRDGARGAEVFLLRRHRGASFMARSFVFPVLHLASGHPVNSVRPRTAPAMGEKPPTHSAEHHRHEVDHPEPGQHPAEHGPYNIEPADQP